MVHVVGQRIDTSRPRWPAALAGVLALVATVVASTAMLQFGGAGPAAGNPASTDQADRWGSYFGDRNNQNADTHRTPAAIKLDDQVVQVATSNSDGYALLTDGGVWAWGQGDHGELGNGASANSFERAVRVDFPAGVKIAYLPTDAMPFDTGLAVDTHGNVWGWGLNSAGQLCLGNKRPQPTPVELPLSGVSLVAGAGDHALYEAGGVLYACGGNENGDLGDGKTTPTADPVAVRGLPNGAVSALVASYHDSGALLADGEYFDWGYNADGQLGDGTATDSWSPVQVQLPLAVTQVTQGGSSYGNGSTLGLLSNGSIRAWGADRVGQLGDGGTRAEPSPVEISPPAGVTYKTLFAAGATSYAISTAGGVYAWGAGTDGELGDGGHSNDPTPELVESGASMISATAENVVTGP